jgi:hypothetical protein
VQRAFSSIYHQLLLLEIRCHLECEAGASFAISYSLRVYSQWQKSTYALLIPIVPSQNGYTRRNFSGEQLRIE